MWLCLLCVYLNACYSVYFMSLLIVFDALVVFSWLSVVCLYLVGIRFYYSTCSFDLLLVLWCGCWHFLLFGCFWCLYFIFCVCYAVFALFLVFVYCGFGACFCGLLFTSLLVWRECLGWLLIVVSVCFVYACRLILIVGF